tara:strand:+ start:567 stop:1403 length:837 start_codon:yes stop_codon:yes gene_type:complete
MKIYFVWLISIIKFILGRRFLLISPPFINKQYWYDREKNKFFVLFNRNVEDWLTNWQVFLQDQFSFSFLRIKSNLTKSSRAQEISEYYNKIIQAGHKPLIIDCGSNNGASSVYFNLSYPESKIISLEIDHNNFLHSLKNTKANQVDIKPLNKGVSSQDGYGEFVDPGLGQDGYRVERKTEANGIPLLSVNSILRDINPEDKLIPFIIKIDIEGGEQDLFSSDTQWVKHFPVLIIELHDWLLPKQKTSLNFIKLISHENRDFVHIGENIFSISNDFPQI